jgi:hypothetical protein
MRDTPRLYLEAMRPPKTAAALGSSIIKHWQSRHLYGKAIVITDTPQEFLKLARKRWQSCMQSVQHERARTLDADELLKLTHAITRMQQMIIAAHLPHEFPGAHLWCITPAELTTAELPRAVTTAYTASPLTNTTKAVLYELLPPHCVIVDYTADTSWHIPSKALLEERVQHAWQELTSFLRLHNIDIYHLSTIESAIEPIDDALDTLLDTGHTFLRHARQFQEALHAAQPLVLPHTLKKQHDLASMLARRVAMLTPGMSYHSLIQPDNDTFSLYDEVAEKPSRETLVTAVARHMAAGRTRLARALEHAFVNNIAAVQ